ncbi:MAG: hypothetical protein ABIU58_07150 [Ramlibacter sp.]
MVTTSLSGNVVKGPVNGATVCAYKATAAGKGEQIKCTTSGAGGAYTMDIAYTGDVVIEATGGNYTDEATSAAKTLGDPMQVVVASQGGATVGVITPLTSAAFSVSKGLSGGVTSANFSTAATTVGSQFKLSGVNLATTLPLVTGTTNSYGQILKAISQYVANGNSLASILAFNSPTALQAGFGTAYSTINGTSVVFTFPGGTVTVGTGSGTGAGGTPAPGTESCGITVSGNGTVTANGFTVPFTLPNTKICVTGVPSGSCSAGNSTLQSLAAAGASPGGNYSINYNYTFAPGDCAGSIATVAFTR